MGHAFTRIRWLSVCHPEPREVMVSTLVSNWESNCNNEYLYQIRPRLAGQTNLDVIIINVWCYQFKGFLALCTNLSFQACEIRKMHDNTR